MATTAHPGLMSTNDKDRVNSLTSSLGAVTIQIGNNASTSCGIRRYGKLRILHFFYNPGSTFGSSTVAIGTVADEDKPFAEQYNSIIGMTSGSWDNASVYNCQLMISTTGELFLRGKTSERSACAVGRGDLIWFVP